MDDELTGPVRRHRPPRPSPTLLAMEQRATFEMGAFLAASPLLRRLGRGDRHPVLVLPGFTASDQSTVPLRSFLRSQGYWVHGWGLGRNIGPTQRIVDGIHTRLVEIHERHGRTVSVVGWSLGGIFARELARQEPDAVRQVITLGSPFRIRDGAGSNVTALYERYERRHVKPDVPIPPEHEREPLAVPVTSIYTRTDGVVHWSTCLEAEGPRRENIEVPGSHSGLGANVLAVLAVADRLAQPEGTWRPFRENRLLARLYPRPVWWEDRSAVPVGG